MSRLRENFVSYGMFMTWGWRTIDSEVFLDSMFGSLYMTMNLYRRSALHTEMMARTVRAKTS